MKKNSRRKSDLIGIKAIYNRGELVYLCQDATMREDVGPVNNKNNQSEQEEYVTQAM